MRLNWEKSVKQEYHGFFLPIFKKYNRETFLWSLFGVANIEVTQTVFGTHTLESYFSFFLSFFYLSEVTSCNFVSFSSPFLNLFGAQESCQMDSVAYQSITQAASRLSVSCMWFGTVFLAEEREWFTMNHLSDKFCLFFCWSGNCPSNFGTPGS